MLMLVARTKSKQDALPKREVIVSGARVLGRTAPAGFSRSETVRAREEERRAVKSIEQSVAETHKAVGVMKVAQDKADRQQARLRGKTETLQGVESRLAQARKELGSAKTEKNDLERQMRVLVRARDRANSDLAKTNARSVELEIKIARNKAVLVATDNRIAVLTAELNDVAKQKTRSVEQQAALETEIRGLQSRSKKYGQKIAGAIQMHESTLATIEEAKDSFRVLEKRIVRFSQETGYIIRYPKVN